MVDVLLSPEAYKRIGGGRCPYCCSTAIVENGLLQDKLGGQNLIECTWCGGVWRERYGLLGYEHVTPPPSLKKEEPCPTSS